MIIFKSQSNPSRCIMFLLLLTPNFIQPVRSILPLAINGETKVSTPLLLPPKDNDASPNPCDFLTDSNNMSLLFSKNGGDGIICKKSYTKDLIMLWSKESKSAGGYDIPEDIETDETCKIFNVTSTTDLFALTIHTINVIGSKMVLPSSNDKNVLPEYQVTLLQNKLVATGSKPAVWLFNKLINSKGIHQNEGEDRGMITAFTRFTMAPSFSDEQNTNKILINAHVCYQMCINMPSFATTVLPITIADLEGKISAAVGKSIEREHEEGLKRFSEACSTWLSQSGHKLSKKEIEFSSDGMKI